MGRLDLDTSNIDRIWYFYKQSLSEHRLQKDVHCTVAYMIVFDAVIHYNPFFLYQYEAVPFHVFL
jgi:hypothetical protein